MNKNYATIDIGTNAYKISIEDAEGVTQFNQNLPSKRIGQSREVDGEYLISCLKEYSEELKGHGLSLTDDNVKVIATENFRRVENSDEVMESVKKDLGVEIEIISKNREADLGMKGALTRAKGVEGKNVLYIDMGGGSTDISLYDSKTKAIESAASIPVGSRLLLEELNTAGKSYEKLIHGNVKRDIRDSIAQFKEMHDFGRIKDNLVILTNASPVLRAINKELGLDRYEPQLVQGNEKKLSDLGPELEKISKMRPQEAINAGYSAFKAAPQVITGAFIMKEVFSELELNNNQPIQASIAGVKEGLIAEMKKADQTKQNTQSKSIEKTQNSLV
ncbi:MAG: hypothetical protein LBR70_03935 [Lactobacillaceae bacterium]|jgi:exopolyphosphatase/guanosine-5'-triphosphate,3'-diphosphate pyrophosphatase|nr:hypothetical protein [Lactobacillaceae bacterium]